MDKTFLRLIELTRRVIKNDNGELNKDLFPNIQDINMWKQIYVLAKAQEVEVFLYESLKDIKLPDEVREKYYSVYNRAVRKEAIMHIEVSNYFAELDRNGVIYMPVKGWILKHLYEKPYLRTMTDVDVLIKESDFKKACEIIEKLGFKAGMINECHNVYTKKPVTEVEVHQKLFSKKSRLHDWGQMIMAKREDFKMDDEDTYIYIIAHMAKHFTKDGAGMRNIIDYYLFSKKHKFNDEQQKYIENTLDELGLKIFKNRIEQMVSVWFDNGKNDSGIEELTEYIMDGGLYGKQGNAGALSIGNQKSQNKFKWMIRELFPDFEMLKKSVGFKKMYRVLTPFYWVYRIVRGLFRRKEAVKSRAVVLSKNEQDFDKSKKIIEYMGMDTISY